MMLLAAQPSADLSKVPGHTMVVLAIALGMLLLLVTVVVLSMLRRAREESFRAPHRPTVLRDAWREAGRRARPEPREQAEEDGADRGG